MPEMNVNRRRLLATAIAGAAALELPLRAFAAAADADADASAADGAGSAATSSASAGVTASLGTLKSINAGVLNVAYFETGPASGKPVLLLHGFPYDVHSYVDVAPALAARGYRVITPYLRGHGGTRFLDNATVRSGQQAAIGQDVVDLMDALKIEKAVLAGYDWGGRAACVVAALWPERCAGLVSVNSYLIQDIAHAGAPIAARIEAGFWYQFYFTTDRGRAGLSANRRDIARILWERNSPTWKFDDATFARSAAAFDNADYVDVVIHSYRHRLGTAPGYAEYAALEKRLAALPAIPVPTITLDGGADGVIAATDGKSSALRFSGRREHRVVAGVGHNLPQEAPRDFVAAILALAA
jgi:pimeloyl-ACP methyl ester carboxylesterase